jgi:hypothetical protein
MPIRALVILTVLAGLAACRVEQVNLNDPTGARASRLDWSLNITDLMPAIKECTENQSRPAANVLKAWPMANDLVGVRMTDLTGKRVDCAAEKGGGRIDSETELVAGDVLPSEGRPTFYPISRGQPLCDGLSPVVVNGIQEGWLRNVSCQ